MDEFSGYVSCTWCFGEARIGEIRHKLQKLRIDMGRHAGDDAVTLNLIARLRDNPAKTYHTMTMRRAAAAEIERLTREHLEYYQQAEQIRDKQDAEIERLTQALDAQHEDCFRLGCTVDRLRAALESVRATAPYNRGTWHDVANRCHEIARVALGAAHEDTV